MYMYSCINHAVANNAFLYLSLYVGQSVTNLHVHVCASYIAFTNPMYSSCTERSLIVHGAVTNRVCVFLHRTLANLCILVRRHHNLHLCPSGLRRLSRDLHRRVGPLLSHHVRVHGDVNPPWTAHWPL